MFTLLCIMLVVSIVIEAVVKAVSTVLSGVVASASTLISNFNVAPVATKVRPNNNRIAEKRNRKREFIMEKVLLMLVVLLVFVTNRVKDVVSHVVSKLRGSYLIAEKRNKGEGMTTFKAIIMFIWSMIQVVVTKVIMVFTVVKAIIKRDIASVLSINEDMDRLISILNGHMADIWLTLYSVIGEDLIINTLIFNKVDCIYSGYISNQKGCGMYIKVYGGSGLRMLSLAVFNAHGRVARPPPVVAPLRGNYSFAEK